MLTCQKNAVALFVRHPVPGLVKTRLARDLGDEKACSFYRAMVSDIISAITVNKLPLQLFHDGNDATGLPQSWLNAATTVVAQQGESIGQRMAAAFAHLFSQGYRQVALLGSDIPGLEATLIRDALQALERDDLAIVPATDGGYCLIAAQQDRYHERIFEEIQWSTDGVLQSTLERIAECGLRVTLLAPRQDIDTCDDLAAYCRTPAVSARATNQWLIESGYLCASHSSYHQTAA